MKKSAKPRSFLRKLKRALKKAFKTITALAIAACVLLALFNAVVIIKSKSRFVTLDALDNMQFDCILVLGAGVVSNSPSVMLEERLDFGVRAFETGCAPKILMSGDHRYSNYDEVNVMKDYALSAGVDTDSVFMDHAGLSTYESMYRARDIFGVKKVLIVTQRYHLYRAVYDALALGLDAYGLPTEKVSYSLERKLFNNSREALARAKDVIWCVLKPEPTYLGEPIDITASGTVTDDKPRNNEE